MNDRPFWIAGCVVLAGAAVWLVITAHLEARKHPPSTVYDAATRQPIPEALAHLQFLADAANCQVSDRSAIMASCVAERIHKVRTKALLWRDKYRALERLERDYWGHLRREGLYPVILHCPEPSCPEGGGGWPKG